MAAAQKKSTSSRSPKKQVIKEKTVVVKERAAGLTAIGGKHVTGFMDFIRTQGVVGLAVGLVLGTAVSVLTKSLIDNVIMPPIGLLLGSGDGLKGLQWTIGKVGDNPAIIHYGTFLNDFINFLVIAAVVYFVFQALGLTKLDKKKD